MARLILFILIQSVYSTTIPVILIDPHATLRPQISNNPFLDTSSERFMSIVLEGIQKSACILIFVEENLSVEDISSKDAIGNPYSNIHDSFLEEKAKYMPRVVKPYDVLNKYLPQTKNTVMEVSYTYDLKRFSESFKYLYVHFAESEARSPETRVQMLRRHDAFVMQACRKLETQRAGPILIFYTGKSNPMASLYGTYKRATKRETVPDSILLLTDHALIRLSGVHLQQGHMRTQLIEPRASTRRFAHRRASTRVLYDDDYQLDFNFEYLLDSWLLDSVVLLEGGEEVGRTTMGVGAPYDWSYFCSEPLIIVNTRDRSYITISKYQVEPLRPNRSIMLQEGSQGNGNNGEDGSNNENGGTEGDKDSFTNTQSCGTNFNYRILAGLMVTFLVLAITAAGVTMLFDCSGNDRMDDPNQKPLVIVAQL